MKTANTMSFGQLKRNIIRNKKIVESDHRSSGKEF